MRISKAIEAVKWYPKADFPSGESVQISPNPMAVEDSITEEKQTGKREDIQICIQPTIFVDYLTAEHSFSEEAAAKVAEDFFAMKLIIRNRGPRTRVQLEGDKIFNILRVPATGNGLGGLCLSFGGKS